jgi:hypothetical protein
MSKATRCHECGGSLLYMPAGYIDGFAYCAACSIKNTPLDKDDTAKALASQIIFDYANDALHGRPVPSWVHDLELERKEGEKTMSEANVNVHISKFNEVEISRPKFKVGDRVKFGYGKMGIVKEVNTCHLYNVEEAIPGEAPVEYIRDEYYLEDAPLTPEEAWDRLAVMLTKAVMTNVVLFGTPLPERISKALRHDAYVILGGAHIKIGENGGPVKNRVRAIIAQAQQ